jgi:DNA invertase Pin-like site-specific DNA recombinase
MKREAPKALRCAIYTRVSTEYGLEQEFNSLDNQREAAEAYIKSQAHEGWRALPAHYDDGGFSGGSMDRPALQSLLSDIRARLVDVVVVYKVDRLTRSLADFAKLVELFDEHGVSFVSVTQAFNTTTSMGRLTLNVLLSFAQFEREVTGERIRDKIAASKKKGMWMGGHVPLGYRVQNRKLVIDDAEADNVRSIFQRYLDLGSLTLLLQDLRARGIRTKQRQLSDGTVRGGIPFTRGPLAYLLKNRTYLGEIVHRGQSHEGEHPAIVDRDVFGRVQALLASGATARRHANLASSSILTGRIFDDRGNRMTPTHAQKNGARYRYYVSCVLLQGQKQDAGSVSRIPALEVEQAVMTALQERTPANLRNAEPMTGPKSQAVERCEKIVVGKDSIEVSMAEDETTAAWVITVPWAPALHYRKREIVTPPAAAQHHVSRPVRAEARARLLDGIAKARLWVDELVSGKVTGIDVIANREGYSERSVRMTLNLAFLAPEIVEAAQNGTLPNRVGLSQMTDLPLAWRDQRQTLGSLIRGSRLGSIGAA